MNHTRAGMKAFFFLGFLICIQKVNGQHPLLNYKYGLRLYNTISSGTSLDIQRVSGPDTFLVKHSETRVFDPAIGLQWKGKKDNFHEIQVTRFQFQNSSDQTIQTSPGAPALINGNHVNHVTAGITYEYSLLLLKRKNAKIIPTISFFGMGYINLIHINPMLASQYKSSDNTFNIFTGVIPGFQVHGKKRLFFSFQIPIVFYNISFNRYRINDPSQTTAEQVTNTFEWDSPYLRYLHLRAGIGLKL